MSELRAKLESEVLPVDWKTLAMHHKREALFVLKTEVSLVDAALAVAEDRAADVGALVESGGLRRPAPAEVEAWEAEEGDRFDFLIVQPFVLARRRDD